MSSGNHYLLITCLCTWVMPLLVLGGNGGHPPRILTHPSADVAFKELEPVELVCEAQGSPKPQYYWEKDGERVELSDGPDGVMLKNGSGTLVIHMPLPASHNGYYQCFAYNDFGVAVTTKAYVKKAELVSFPSVRVPQVHRPDVGAPLTLYCKPPKSHPSGVIYWGETSSGSRLHPINNTDRVSQDYSGSLHFSNIVADDGLYYPAALLLCAVYNPVLRSLVQGDDHRIEPQTGNLHFTHIEPGDYLNNEMYICIVKEDVAIRGLVTGSDQRINPVQVTPTYRPPERMWSSGPKEIAIRGEPKRMKCIFSGYPTPRVTWSRVGRVDNYSVGQEITIERASPDDAGRYRCSARNSESGQPVSIDIELAVESAPFWRRGRSPQDATVAEDDDVEFECVADGVPAPTVSWSFNGRPYNKTLQLMPDSRPIVSKDRVTFLSVMKNDSQVLQCNASNVHGYILANAYLSVRAEPPSVLQAPVDKLKVAEGRSAMFSCRMEGAPKPTIKWTRGDSKTLVTGERFVIQTSGDLEILDASVEDSDVYYCTGKNKLGEETVHGQLIVRNKTLITEPPWSQTVNLSSRVKFECKATTDQHEMSGLTITWYKDDQPLDLSSHMNTSFIVINDSLIIDTAQVSDSGAYKCRADNKVDSDEVTVQLIVRDRPQAPTNVRLDRCMTNRAELSWIASVDNNDRIQEYVVFYNSSHDPPDSYHVGIRTHMTSAIVHPLSPWTNYTFHVTAQNSMGMSDRSAFTHALCLTPQARPFQSPTHVCTHNGKPEELVIMWKPMQRSELNGENFHYMVKYSPAPERGQDGDIAQETTVNVSDWQQREVIIPNQGTYRRFRISVLAANDKGTAPENQAIVVYGHSSEGVPSVVPENFRIKEETLNRTSVVFMWDPVNTDAVNGFFKGFQVRFWKRGNADDVRREDLILSNPPADCDLNSKKSLKPSRLRRQESLTSYSLPTHRLWGGATISAAAVVMNRVSAGALSDAIQFTTPEGVPEAVSSFSVLERGVRHLKLGWKPPSEINGILDHFIISYTVSSGSSHSKFEKIDNPQQTTDKIVDLQPETTYNISISAHTATGGGPETTIVASTRSEPLDVPCIDNITLGEDFVVITWRPSCENPVKNPGSKFVVEYHTEDMMEQNTSSIEMPYDLVNLTGLSPGKTYEIVVVAMNKAGEKTSSKPETFVLGHPPEPILQTSGISIWIIILILAILLFLLIIFLICCIKQRRQGKYPVYEKEKLHGCNPDNNEEEPKFGEYTKSNAPTLRPTSHGSVDSMEKPLESETNSLAEYEDTDPMKFNEDGSFIGQYGGQKKVAPTGDHNAPFVAIV